MMELNNIYQGDCRKLLKLIDSDSIDLVCSDVAYPVQSRGGSGSMGGYWTESQTRKGKIFKNNDIDISDYINDLYRILKDRSHCYLMCNDYNLMHFLDVVGKSEFHFTKCLIWDKCEKICGRYYMAQKEYIIMLRKGGDRPINECGTSDILSVPIPTNKRKDKDGLINQTEKPVKLMEILIRNSTNVDDVVLDPFMGSGTTARACVNLERKYIGFEIDQRQVDFANNELKNMSRQLSLF